MSTYYLDDGTHGYSIIRNAADSANLAAVNSEVTDHETTTLFILETQFWYGAGCNKTLASTGVKLQFDKDDAGSWTDVGAATEIAFTDQCSGITDEGASADRSGDPSAVACASGFQAGVQSDDAATALGIAVEQYSNVQWGLDPANAAAGSSYKFRGWDTTNDAVIPGSVSAFITIKAAETIITPGTGSASLSGKNLIASTGVTQVIGVGSLAATGEELWLNRTRVPGIGSLTLSGKELNLTTVLTLALDALNLTGRSFLSYLNITLSIAKDSLTLTGFDVSLSKILTAATKALALVGKALEIVGATIITPATGALNLTGLDAKANRTRVIAVKALTLTGRAFLTFLHITQTITVKALSLTGFSVFQNRTRTPAIGSLALTGKDLSASAGIIIQIGRDVLALTGKNLIRYLNVTQSIATGILTIAGKTLAKFFNITKTIATGTLTLATKAFEVVVGLDVVQRGLSHLGLSTRMK